MSKPTSEPSKDKADDAQQSVTPPSPARNKSAIQRQLELAPATPETVIETNSARAAQPPTPAADNKLLRNALFAAATLFFGGLTFWLGLQFSHQPTLQAPLASSAKPASPEPEVAAASTSIAYEMPSASSTTDNANNESAALVETASQEDATDVTTTTPDITATAATAVVAIQSAAVTGNTVTKASQTEPITKPAESAPASVEAAPSAEQAMTVEDRAPEPKAETTKATAVAATAILTASAVVATQSPSSTQTAAPITQPTQPNETTPATSPTPDSTETVPSSEQAMTAEDTVAAPEPDAEIENAMDDSSSDANTTALAATAAVTATAVVATQTASTTRTAAPIAQPTESAQASEATPSPGPDSVEVAPTTEQAMSVEDKIPAPEQTTAIDKANDEAMSRFLADYGKQSKLIIQRNIIYPSRAIKRRQEGKVAIEILVDRDGKVLDMIVVEDPGHQLLVKAVKRAIKKSKNLAPLPADFPDDNFRLMIPIVFKLP